MVGAGVGVTIIPEMARAVETRSADVVCDSFDDPQPGRTIGMIWRKTDPLAPTFEEIAKVVQSAGVELCGQVSGQVRRC
jgi:LysR family hydrogen peroxide-inducible transcriptional activator